MRALFGRKIALVIFAGAIVLLLARSGPPRRADKAPDPDREASRLRTLGYAAWNEAARGPAGVVKFDPSEAFDGVNAFVQQGRIVFMDMRGQRLHSIELPTPDGKNLEAFAPYGPGRFLALNPFLTLVGSDSEVEWQIKAPFHHDIAVADDGTIYTLGEKRRIAASIDPAREIVDQSIVLVTPAGEIMTEVWFSQLIEGDAAISELARRFLEKDPDVFHINTIELVRRDGTGPRGERLRAGDVIFASRSLNLVGAADLTGRKIRWSWGSGILDGPHSPRLTADGTIMIFDNGRFTRRYSRILELDPLSGEIAWSYEREPPSRFFSRERGAVEPLPNGNVLVSDSVAGRAFEYSRSKKRVVWKYVSTESRSVPQPGGGSKHYRLSIPRMMRLSREELPFLNSSASSFRSAEKSQSARSGRTPAAADGDRFRRPATARPGPHS